MRDTPGYDWDLIRKQQLRATLDLGRIRQFVNAVLVIAAAILFRGTVSPWLLAFWAAASIGYSLFTFRQRSQLAFGSAQGVSRGAMLADAARIGVIALSWAIPALLFAQPGNAWSVIGLWTILAFVMSGAALTLAAVPLSTGVFIGLLGLSSVMMMVRDFDSYLAAVIAGYTVLLIGGTIAWGRRFVDTCLASAALVERNEVVSLLLREFEESGADWLWQTDAARCLVDVSPRLAHALGREPAGVEGRPLLRVLAGAAWESGKFPDSLHLLADKMKRRESFSDLLVEVEIGGQTRWWELSATARVDEKGKFQGFRGVGSDVTQQRETVDRIAHLARFDTLTGLPNRTCLTEELRLALAEAHRSRARCGFFMIDLDRFKAVNDTLGHPIGDRLLEDVAARLREACSENELCGRLGGDEFAVVLRRLPDSDYVETLANRIIARLSQPYEVDQHTLYIGASVGSAIAPRDGASVDMLLRAADLALYRSKDGGGGVHTPFEHQLQAHAEERRLLEIALRDALARDQFSVHFQPVVAADSGRLIAFEALLRWRHPELGEIPPSRFIPVAEDARLIAAIGEWVLRTACREAMRWPAHIRVAVNVSCEQLHDPNFVTSIISALSHSGIAADRLELEVTEGVFLREGTGAVAVLDQILSLGIRLSLDNFGTGYSSLGYLRKARFSTIKIDRRFIAGAADHAPESLAIVRAVVAIADSLDMSTTAEGAETREQVEVIRRLGCQKIQGFYFGRPMSARDAFTLASGYGEGAAAVA